LRKTNLFEKIVFILGIFVVVVGFFMINSANSEASYLKLVAIFSWLTLLFIMILSATNEDVKEELGEIIKEHIIETKLLKELNHDILAETKMLREDLKKAKK